MTIGFFLSPLQISFWIISFALLGFLITKSQSKKPTTKPKLPPGPKPWPIVGNLPEMLANRPTYKWIHKMMEDLNTEIACIRLGNVNVIPVLCPAIAREFLRKQDATFASRPLTMSTDIISDGYLTTILGPFGVQWLKMKKIIINELLAPHRHQWLQDKRNEEANNLMFYIYNNSINGGLVDVRIASRQYCGNVYRKLIFNKRFFGNGMEDGGPGIEETEHLEAIFVLLKHIYVFSPTDYMPFLRLFDFDGHKSNVKNAMRIMNKHHDPIIDERIQQWNDGSRTSKEDLLDVLISLKDDDGNPLLTLKEIKAQITEIMMAVVDNPSNAAEWILGEMINRPELFEKAIDELDRVVGTNRMVEEYDIPKLNFIKALAKEAFRLHPTMAFNVPHACLNDTMVGDYMIPKGSHVLIGRRGLGRNPKVWSEPNTFLPERHLKNDGSDVALAEPDLRLISFSTGRRGCPGLVLGTSMAIMLLARMLHGFTWTAPPNVTTINLIEHKNDMFLDEPLVALAKPRLAPELYSF